MSALRTIQYTDADGRVLDVQVTEEVAAVLARDPDQDGPPQEVPVSVLFGEYLREWDLASVDWLSHELRLYYRGLKSRIDVSSWDGPRYAFTLLIGVGQAWARPARGGPCPACAGRRLEEYAVCLYCNRTGRDLDIPPVPRELWRHCARVERERLRAEGRGDGKPRLKGGKG
jgi:hypothetical protein